MKRKRDGPVGSYKRRKVIRTKYPIENPEFVYPTLACSDVLLNIFQYTQTPNLMLSLSKSMYNYFYPHILLTKNRVKACYTVGKRNRFTQHAINPLAVNRLYCVDLLDQSQRKTFIHGLVKCNSVSMIKRIMDNGTSDDLWKSMMSSALKYKKPKCIRKLMSGACIRRINEAKRIIYEYIQSLIKKDELCVIQELDDHDLIPSFGYIDFSVMCCEQSFKILAWIINKKGFNPMDKHTPSHYFDSNSSIFYRFMAHRFIDIIYNSSLTISSEYVAFIRSLFQCEYFRAGIQPEDLCEFIERVIDDDMDNIEIVLSIILQSGLIQLESPFFEIIDVSNFSSSIIKDIVECIQEWSDEAISKLMMLIYYRGMRDLLNVTRIRKAMGVKLRSELEFIDDK